MNKLLVYPGVLILGLTGSFAKAQKPPASLVPQSAFFIGIGGSANSTNFDNQSTWGKGTSYSPPYTPPVGSTKASITGSAEGGTDVHLPSQNNFSPSIHAGFFKHFSASKWLWGAKFSYNNLQATSTVNNQLIPQSGGYTQGGVYTPFNGNYLVRSYQQSIEQQFSLMPFIGHSFEKSYIYAGAGPTYSQIKTSLNSLTGFANFVGIPTAVTGLGNTSSYAVKQWVWGGAAMIGGTYFLDKNWFVDLNYTISKTSNHTTNWGGPWSFGGDAIDGPRTGTNQGTSSGSIVNQSLTLSLNMAF